MSPQEFKTKFIETNKKIGKAIWSYMKKARLELIVLAAVLVFDLVTKAIVASALDENESFRLIPNFLHFTYVKNYAAAFSSDFGLSKIMSPDGVRIVFIIITFLATGVFAFFMWRGRGGHKVMRLAYALIISGALGNLIDRLFLGYVRDFVEIVYFGLTVPESVPLIGGDSNFAIFNIADVSLVVGVILFAVYYIILYKDPKKDEPQAEQANETTAESVTESVTEQTNETVTEQSSAETESQAERANETTTKTVTEQTGRAKEPKTEQALLQDSGDNE